MHEATDTHEAHSEAGHVVSLPLLAGILLVLLFFTFITGAVTWVDLGALNVWVALLIAAVKASLVGLYFMHLRWDSPFNAVVLICALLFVAIFIGFALLDTMAYHSELTPPRNVTVFE